MTPALKRPLVVPFALHHNLTSKGSEEEERRDLHWAIRLRKRLLIPGSWKWNAWVRDVTARLERE